MHIDIFTHTRSRVHDNNRSEDFDPGQSLVDLGEVRDVGTLNSSTLHGVIDTMSDDVEDGDNNGIDDAGIAMADDTTNSCSDDAVVLAVANAAAHLPDQLRYNNELDDMLAESDT